jgi:hypothetical protein
VGAVSVRDVESHGLQMADPVVGNGPVDVVHVPGSANHIESTRLMPGWHLSAAGA